LIELIVVVLIIGILMSVFVVKFRKWEAMTYKSRAVNDLTAMLTALELYLIENNGKFPPDAVRNIPV
jgi:type II secretory pathway pseudopilin PulG